MFFAKFEFNALEKIRVIIKYEQILFLREDNLININKSDLILL